MPVKAPFRFARINRWIYEPAWAGLVSHDVPFADGLSGEAEVEITATSSILVGGDRRKATAEMQGEVRPFRLPDGTYAIPGSALQGMTRAVLEIAGFGRLGPQVQNRKFGIRDLSGTQTAYAHYQSRLSKKQGNRVTINSKAGWLIKRADDRPCIVPCKYARIHLDDVLSFRMALVGGPSHEGVLYQRSDAGARYKWFLGGKGKAALDSTFALGSPEWHLHQENARNGPIRIQYQRCVYSTTGRTLGTIVFTGKPQRGVGAGHKKLEFVFHDPNRAAASVHVSATLPVPDDAWQAFKLLHQEQPGGPVNPNWDFWKVEYKNGKPIPVFYWEADGKIETFGMAFAFKAAHSASTHDLLANSCPGHIETIADMKLDLPHLIFGVAAEHEGGRGLKRRARFGLARTTDAPKEHKPRHPSVLLGPKPGYAGIYVRQRHNNRPVKGQGSNPLATYTPYAPPDRRSSPHLARPELSGVKIWPARSQRNEPFDPGPISPDVVQNLNVQTDLVTLPPGTVFKSRLAFHNLRPVELGAVLWVLSFGDPAAFGDDPGKVTKRHRLGMGKPLGLGEVAIRVTGLLAEPACCPDDACSTESFDASKLASAFERHMEGPGAYGPKWRQSTQVLALHKAATPGSTANLEYMVLDARGPNGNEFQQAAKKGEYLPDYAPSHSHEKSLTNPTALEPALTVGTRVRVIPRADQRWRNREATVVRIGNGPNPKCTVRFIDNNRNEQLRQTLLVAIKAPPS